MRIIAVTCVTVSCIFSATFGQAVKSEVVSTGSGFQLLRAGQPYFIKGAGGYDYPERLALYGGNSTRTWGTDANTIHLLNDAQAKGISVLLGLWVGHEAHGFNYNDPLAVQKQLDDFRLWVELYKDHPAVLGWGIGNEVELGLGTYNLKVWNAINDISAMIHEVDGNHFTLTVTAGIDVNKAQVIKERAPDLDMLGVNAYGGIGGVPSTLQNADWNKPYIITEWGPNGQWEVAKTSWGAPIEQTSSEKADVYKQRYETVIAGNPGKCLGSYVFLWSNKLEETPTWYGLFLPNGDEMETVDVMHYVWKGAWPVNRAPRIVSATVENRQANQSIKITKDTDNIASVLAIDAEGDALSYEFLIIPQEGYNGTVQDAGHTFPYLPNLIIEQAGHTVTFKAPANDRNYRLYMIVRDVHGNAASVNIPFRVELAPLVSTDPAILFTSQDAYIRDGIYSTERFGVTDRDRLVTRKTTQSESGLNREAYIEFDISSLSEGFNQVDLEVFGSASETTEVAVFGTTDFAWTENALSWNNRFTRTVTKLDSTILVGNEAPRYHRWRVDALIYEALITRASKVTFLMRNTTPTTSTISWNSREVRSNPPRLHFELNGGELITSVKEQYTPGVFSIWPNPFHEKIECIATHDVMGVEITEATGRELFRISMATNTTTIDTRQWRQGLYFLLVIDSKGRRHITKVIKQ
jgi:hypothetical protein